MILLAFMLKHAFFVWQRPKELNSPLDLCLSTRPTRSNNKWTNTVWFNRYHSHKEYPVALNNRMTNLLYRCNAVEDSHTPCPVLRRKVIRESGKPYHTASLPLRIATQIYVYTSKVRLNSRNFWSSVLSCNRF